MTQVVILEPLRIHLRDLMIEYLNAALDIDKVQDASGFVGGAQALLVLDVWLEKNQTEVDD